MRSRRISSIAGYALSVTLSAAVTLAAIPIIIGAAGSTAWSSLALAQAVGSAAAIVVGFGWGITGPTEVASSGPVQRAHYFTLSVWGRAAIAVPALIVAAAVTTAAAPTEQFAAASAAVSYGLGGLLSGWFFTGVAKPWWFFTLDALPRVIGVAAGALLVASGFPLWCFSCAVLVGVLAGVCATVRSVTGRFVPERVAGPDIARVLRDQSHGMQLSTVSALVTALPPVLVSMFAPAALPAYTLGDKLFRFATTGFAPVLQYLQGWVPAASGTLRIARATRAAKIGILLAVLGAGAFVVAAPIAGDLLSHGAVEFDFGLACAFALAFASVVGAQVVGLIGLLSLGAARAYARYATIGAAVGMSLALLGAFSAGGVGAAAGFAVGEFIALALEARLFVSLIRASLPPEDAPSDPLPAP